MTTVEKRAIAIIIAAFVAGAGVWTVRRVRLSRLAAAAPIAITNEASDILPESGSLQVNINTAGEYELEALPGIGPVLAARIVADREKQGPFSAVEQIQRVSGIGPKRFELLRDLIVVGAAGP